MKNVLIITRDPLVHPRQTINGSGLSDDCKCRFFINKIDCTPDFVVVMNKGLVNEACYLVPKSRTLLLTTEPHGIYEYPKSYCMQFGTVMACQPELKLPSECGTRVLYTPAVLPWFVGGVFGINGCSMAMDREDISSAAPKKEKLISVITSRKAFTKGHIDRLRFVNKLNEFFGDRVDIFGAGFRKFDDKWEAIAPYKYHIVIENTEGDYYWTEKLADCYLAGAYPLYHGCTNIGEYFPEGAYTQINVRDFDSVARLIDGLEREGLYENRKHLLEESKKRVLSRYNMFNLIADAIAGIECDGEEGTVRIKPASAFFSFHNLFLHTIEWSYYKMLGNYFV